MHTYGADVAQRIDEIIERDGACTPSAVVKDGESPSSPFHRYLQWNNEAAAEEYRIAQARQIIRWFRVVELPASSREPVYIHVAEVDATDTAGYVRRETAMADPAMRLRYLRSELAQIEGLVRRVGSESEFAPLVGAIETVRAALIPDLALATAAD